MDQQQITVNGKKVLRIGVIGCGEIFQVSHLSTLSYLSELFQITYLCDVSQQALDHCAAKVAPVRPQITTKAEELCSSSRVDAVVVCSATALHTPHAILALQNNKHVFVEKPLALCYRDLDALAAAEDASTAHLFVGYMRRYAPAFIDALTELGSAPIQYVRVRDIIGPNAVFVSQSDTFPRRFSDIQKEHVEELDRLNEDVCQQALPIELGIPVNEETDRALWILCGLGSHDISAMREAIGMPLEVKGACLSWPIWSALFQYEGFPVVYESGINSVPVFDAHIEIYTSEKIVRVNYDTPYVKGLPTTVTVREKARTATGESCYVERHIRQTYENSYTIEFRQWHDCIVGNRTPKTSIADARQDHDIFTMLLQSAFKKPSS